MSKEYIVFDGRANYDEDEATVLEVLGEFHDDKSAWAEFQREWGGMDACLFAYGTEGETLVDGEQVFGNMS